MTKDDDGHIDGTKNGEFVCLFEETAFSFQKSTARRMVSVIPGSQRKIPNSETYTERLRSSLIALISIFLRPMEKEAEKKRGND